MVATRALRTLLIALCCLSTPLSAEVRVSAVALFKGKAMLNIDGHQHMLKVGETSSEGVTLIAADPTRVRISIAGSIRDLKLDTRIGGALGKVPENTIVRLVPGRHGHYFSDGQINGNPIRFLVDTGATSVAINKNMARQIGLQYQVDGQRGLVDTANGTVAAYRVICDEVKIQALTLKRVPGVVLDGDSPSEALLGQSFLNRLDIHRQGAVLELRAR